MEKLLSITIPVYEEQGNIPVITKRLVSILSQLPYAYEIIFADDGSKDGTWDVITNEARKNPAVKGVRLSRNFGHQHALIAAMNAAKGDAIISMDGDLQHPPELIPQLVEAWEKGYPVVQTQRIDTKETGFFKKKTSEYFYKLFSYLSNVKMAKGSSDFRLIDSMVLKNLLGMEHAFIRGAIEWLGYESIIIPFEVGERFSGRSKYSLKKMFSFAHRALISHSTKPLRIGIWIGALTSMLSFLQLTYVIYQYSNGNVVPGWASTIGIISFLFGVLFIMVGIIGMYIAEIHEKLHDRPHFIIKDMINEPARQTDRSAVKNWPISKQMNTNDS